MLIAWLLVGFLLMLLYFVINIIFLSFSGLLLMGFKPRSSLKNYFHIRPAQFLYPSEKVCTATVLKNNIIKIEEINTENVLITLFFKKYIF